MIKLHKRGKSNVEITRRLDMNRSMVWKIVKNSRRPKTPLTDQGAQENGVSDPLNFSKIRRKSCDEPSLKLQNLGYRSRCEQMHQVLREDLGVKPFKLLHRQELTANHMAMRTQNARKSSKRWLMARCRTSCSRTRRNSTSSRW